MIGIAQDWAFTHGLVMKSASNPNEAIHAPFALHPSPFPRECFYQAIRLAPYFNRLVDQLAQDEAFIDAVMQELSSVDDFMARLYDIFNNVRGDQRIQKINFGIHRSDYLLHRPTLESEPSIRQVELNTIASSFSSLSGKASELHAFLKNYTLSTDDLPLNGSCEKVPLAIQKAFNLYGNEKQVNSNSSAVVLFIVQPNERNIFDQRWIELKLAEFGIKCARKTLKQVNEESSFVGNTLFINETPVALVYFRAGYTPNDYPTDSEWRARLSIEQSDAIKCPNINYHIVGAKKVQQIVADSSVLSRYLDPKQVELVTATFCGLYPLDQSEQGKSAYEMALKNPKGLVMKPQREGGGNNFYGLDIPPVLSKLDVKQRNAYILMDLIQTPPHKNTLVKSGVATEAQVISELGVYGVWLSENSQVFLNEEAGYLLRTKAVGTNEGGVATGYSVLDSVRLV